MMQDRYEYCTVCIVQQACWRVCVGCLRACTKNIKPCCTSTHARCTIRRNRCETEPRWLTCASLNTGSAHRSISPRLLFRSNISNGANLCRPTTWGESAWPCTCMQRATLGHQHTHNTQHSTLESITSVQFYTKLMQWPERTALSTRLQLFRFHFLAGWCDGEIFMGNFFGGQFSHPEFSRIL